MPQMAREALKSSHYIRIDQKALELMRDPDTGKRSLELAGLYSYFYGKTPRDPNLAQYFCLTDKQIEEDLGLSSFRVAKWRSVMEAAGLIRHWISKGRTHKGNRMRAPHSYYQLNFGVLPPLIDRRIQWPSADDVKAYHAARETYRQYHHELIHHGQCDREEEAKRLVKGVEKVALTDFIVARMYPKDRPPKWVERRLRDGVVFAEDPMALQLQAAESMCIPELIASIAANIPSDGEAIQQHNTQQSWVIPYEESLGKVERHDSSYF